VITWRALQDQNVIDGVEALRRDSLRFFILCAAIGFLGWHFVDGAIRAGHGLDDVDLARRWAIVPIALAGLGATLLLLQRESRLAAPCFLVTSLVSVTTALWLTGQVAATMLYPLLVLVAVVLLHPLAGLIVGVVASGTLLLLSTGPSAPLGFVEPERIVEVAVASLLTVTAAWALGRNMVIAVEWSLASFSQAVVNAEEARTNRAELAAALKQLDHANYRLQRANSALELAWAAAEAAERAKSEFVTNISHELRTPINLVVGFSEMILTAPESYGLPLPAPYRGDLNAIYRSAQHLLTLTNDVIDLARVGMGRLAIVREPVNLRAIVDDACEIVRAYVTAKGLWLQAAAPAELPLLQLDRLRLRQVLLNLLTNAARFTEHGGITITIDLEEDEVRVAVADTGPGIAPDDLPQVFTEFHHDGSDLGASVEGLGGIGLGLPISKRMVELHGGHMGVESTVGIGTTFWLSLPRTADASTDEMLSLAGRTRALASHQYEGERIVVLAGSGRPLGRFVERHLTGVRVVPVADMRTARQAAVEYRAHAILTDRAPGDVGPIDDLPVPLVRLPVPDGSQLAEHFGVLAFLTKPVSQADFAASLAKVPGSIGRVLIADDDPWFGRLVARMVAVSSPGANVEVMHAHTGREALDLMAERRPDLLLLDLAMPELGGREVIAAMRASPALADLPVIVMSAQDEIAGRFPLHGELGVCRPDGFRLEEALAAVEAILGVLEPPRRYLTEHAESDEPAVMSKAPG
jgi:signal transduction histidine kinase/CheY-like chemotaxis protein